jgi:hypothetical protein
VPAVIVCGDSAPDFCYAFTRQRVVGHTYWLPVRPGDAAAGLGRVLRETITRVLDRDVVSPSGNRQVLSPSGPDVTIMPHHADTPISDLDPNAKPPVRRLRAIHETRGPAFRWWRGIRTIERSSGFRPDEAAGQDPALCSHLGGCPTQCWPRRAVSRETPRRGRTFGFTRHGTRMVGRPPWSSRLVACACPLGVDEPPHAPAAWVTRSARRTCSVPCSMET